jgi:hypothetical protein
MKKRFSDYPKNVPHELIRALRAAGSTRKLEKQIGVNNFYICKLLNEGIEPTNPEIRVKLFLDKPRKPRRLTPKTIINDDRGQSWTLYMRHVIKTMRTPTPKQLAKELKNDQNK